MIERGHLICLIMGFYIGKNNKIDPKDLRISIDQQLIKANQPPTTSADSELIQQGLDELIMFSLGKGTNRESRRKTL